MRYGYQFSLKVTAVDYITTSAATYTIAILVHQIIATRFKTGQELRRRLSSTTLIFVGFS